MKVLWITNILFPEASAILSGEKELKATGGWLLGSAEALVKDTDIELTVAAPSRLVNKPTCIQGERIQYYAFPPYKNGLKYSKKLETMFVQIKEQVRPDVVHIHGTEFTWGLAYVNACGAENVVVSIQGMKSAYYYYYYYGLTKCEIYNNLTIHDILRGTIIQEQKSFKKSGLYEIELLKKVYHIIGRTSWDRGRTWAINPDAQYHFCNETLRKEFYDGSSWNFENCKKHSIFLSQGNYPIKGLHQLLEAMPIILRHYPDATIRIAGKDISTYSGFSGWIRYSGYGRLINRMIKRKNLVGKVMFTGTLNAEQMKQEYLKCNVFVSPSTIENSPNSLGEAQILGTPCVVSYVGGVMDMMKGNEENMYRFEEVGMLAEKVCRVFENEGNQVDIRAGASRRHNPQNNVEQLVRIYNSIIRR